MEKINEEVDQVILHTIKNRGVTGFPLDIRFLERYNLKKIYYLSTSLSTDNERTHDLEGLYNDLASALNRNAKELASRYIQQGTNFETLAELYHNNGKRAIAALLKNDENYLRTLKKLIRK